MTESPGIADVKNRHTHAGAVVMAGAVVRPAEKPIYSYPAQP